MFYNCLLREGKARRAKERSIVSTQWTEVLSREQVSIYVTKDQQGHRRQLVLEVNNIRHVAGERLFCNEHNSDAINRRWKEWGTEHRRTSWL